MERLKRIKYGWYSVRCAFQLWSMIMGNTYDKRGIVGWINRPQNPQAMLENTLYFFWEEISTGEESW